MPMATALAVQKKVVARVAPSARRVEFMASGSGGAARQRVPLESDAR